jgi:hypothetical protein
MPPWLPGSLDDPKTYVTLGGALVTLLYAGYLLVFAIPPSAALLRWTVDATTRGRWSAAARDIAFCIFYLAGEKKWVTTRRLYRAARILVELRLFDTSLHHGRKAVREQLRSRTPLVLTASAVDETASVPPIRVETCFDLSHIEEEIKTYFEALRDQALLSEDEEGRFLCTVTVATGYVTPLYLLAGLVTHFEDDWKPIITQYGRAVTQPGHTG